MISTRHIGHPARELRKQARRGDPDLKETFPGKFL
jgi:hypothetical protein